MSEIVPGFPRVSAAVQDGISRGLQTGIQIYVSVGGQPVIDGGYGMATRSIPMTPYTIMPWRSAGKPLTVVLLIRMLNQNMEPGREELNDEQLRTQVKAWLPEFADSEIGDTTLQQILTHTGGFPMAETGWPSVGWKESLERLRRATREAPTGTAAYHPQSSWFLLGEICRRLSGTEAGFSELMLAHVLEPLGMLDTSAGRSLEEYWVKREQMPTLYERVGASMEVSAYSEPPYATQESPGASLRGPVRDLGRFYEMMMRGGVTSNGERWICDELLRKCTLRHREAEYDRTFQHTVDFGLGWIVNSNRYGEQTVPYGFGRLSTEAAFGHGGSQCSMAFCDPERQIVVAWSANGFCGEGQHQRRNRNLNESIYSDIFGPE
ncbi:MAG: beta-lactamase family protein [Planctomyces sp.]|nr:beta-lactamase family protein [Planctomyces sp.]